MTVAECDYIGSHVSGNWPGISKSDSRLNDGGKQLIDWRALNVNINNYKLHFWIKDYWKIDKHMLCLICVK